MTTLNELFNVNGEAFKKPLQPTDEEATAELKLREEKDLVQMQLRAVELNALFPGRKQTIKATQTLNPFT